MTIGFFADRTGINAAKKEFVTSLLWKGALAFALVLPVMLVLVHFATRQLLLLADAMKNGLPTAHSTRRCLIRSALTRSA